MMISYWLIILLIILTFVITIAITPYVIQRMRNAGIIGIDVNKPDKPKIPEMCGIAGVFAFAVSGTILAVVTRLYNIEISTMAIVGTLCAMTLGGIIGLIDDLYGIRWWKKGLYVLVASLPLAILGIGSPTIATPWYTFDFSGMSWLFWLILVPIGVTGMANALNMSAGYNGIETGQMSIISGVLLLIAFIKDPANPSIPIFAMLLGASLGLFLFNRYPARMFIGDIGTLGMGAGIGAGVIIGGLEFYGVICILPMFYELIATLYARYRNVERRPAVMNPIILKDGRIKPRKGTDWYTLSFRLLSWRSMREPQLVVSVLTLFLIAGAGAIGMVILAG